MRYYSGQETMHEIAASQNKSYEAQRKSILRARLSLTDCIEETLAGSKGQS